MKHLPLKLSSAQKAHYLTRHELRRRYSDKNINAAAYAGTLSPDNGAASANPINQTSAASVSKVTSSPAASVRPTSKGRNRLVSRGITEYIHPVDLQEQITFEVLRCLARFRIVRAVDIAVACFAERPYPAARQAARRALRGLMKRRCVLSYKTERHQTIYAMTEAGARVLGSHGIEAKASIRSAANMVNPNHSLWLNFVALCCEARGLEALTESELMRTLNQHAKGITDVSKRGLLSVTTERKTQASPSQSPKKTRVSLLADVIALEEDGITWFEIDASKRGAARMARLLALVRKVGQPLTELAKAIGLPKELSYLKRVSLHASNASYFQLLRNKLFAEVRATAHNILTESDNNCRTVYVGDDTFEVWRAQDSLAGQEDVCVGHVILHMLPTGLPNYQGSDVDKSKPAGWFEDNYLPYRRLKCAERWREPASQFPLKLTTDAPF